jgi:DNA polymerase III epsilon subunit-like protein
MPFDDRMVTGAILQHAPHLFDDWAQVSRNKWDTMDHHGVSVPQPTLNYAAKKYGIVNSGAHNSLDDARTAALIFHQQHGRGRLGERLELENEAINSAIAPKNSSSVIRPTSGIKFMNRTII